ncbi:M23 family metallopeptidase [Nonomuraea jiangxiensis]|uniref:M23 family metallopeptidase n=1 Tax=Nonomuraea jiangxiensis TaxID=633440 RepID=UPI001C409AEA
MLGHPTQHQQPVNGDKQRPPLGAHRRRHQSLSPGLRRQARDAQPLTWRWPLAGSRPRILRRFAPPPKPWLAGHRGIDLAAPTSTPVLAAGPGKVIFAGPVAGKGVISIDHPNGLRTTYLPVKPSVSRGQLVTAGTRLGVIEAAPTPHCQQSCLHWGLRRNTVYLDPLLLLAQAPIRLLPHWPPTAPTTPTPSPNRLPNQAPSASSNFTLTTPKGTHHPPALADMHTSPTSSAGTITHASLRSTPGSHQPSRSSTPTTTYTGLTPTTFNAQQSGTSSSQASKPLPPAPFLSINGKPPLATQQTTPRTPLSRTTSSTHTTSSSNKADRSTPTPTTHPIPPRSAEPLGTLALVLGVLLGNAVLAITALRLRRRSRTKQHSPRRGQHRKQRRRRRPRKHRPCTGATTDH